jgi:hypothetical protein
MSDVPFQRFANPPFLARSPRRIWLWPLLVYAILVVPAVWLRRGQINPDSICYIRLSTYLLRHDWSHAVSGYWSPLFPWCMAPLLATGMEGLVAAHVMLGVIGAVYLIAAHQLLKQFDAIQPAARFWMMMIAALVTVRLVVKIISPDLLMAAILLFYLAAMHRRDVLRRPMLAFLAGILGGLAYLAKAYALPFFIAHFLLTLLLRGWISRREADPIRRVGAGQLCAVALAGMLGCLLVAGPWIALLSHSYGRLTISTAGPFNHNEAPGAPEELKYRFSFFIPPDPYLTESEIIDRRVTRFWSPFDSAERMRRQWRIAEANTPQILATLGSFDRIWLVPVCLAIASALGITLMLRRRVQTETDAWELPWLAMTLLVYCSGFTIVYFESRLIEAALRFPAMLLCVLLAIHAGQHVAARSSKLTRCGTALPIFVLVVFSVSALIDLPRSFTHARRDGMPRAVADAMRAAQLHGPIASSNRGIGGYVAYFLNAKLITIPVNQSASDYQRECDMGHACCVVVVREFGDGRIPPQPPPPALMTVVEGSGWTRRVRIADARMQIDVYERTAD